MLIGFSYWSGPDMGRLISVEHHHHENRTRVLGENMEKMWTILNTAHQRRSQQWPTDHVYDQDSDGLETMMLFELRQYRAHPGQRDRLVEMMETEIIPFQVAKGMVIVGSFVGEEDPDLYVWIRRFDSEEQRITQYAAVYESDVWKNDFAVRIPEILNRESIQVTRLTPTATSVIH
jgi:hypothetical protein